MGAASRVGAAGAEFPMEWGARVKASAVGAQIHLKWDGGDAWVRELRGPEPGARDLRQIGALQAREL